ncbi:LacI family DNA-binding transcriptional regulator [Saccharopolyspora erythraea]|uniref:LacI family DNA-binding transcriptional regulator n=1 Tax=Saccharopolyspora erythraea TaxID=1836 RepID=UPI001BA8D0C8|nr:LacI family DNA-binding transcriptional regulator [Saccharopolyspora erythraea]QUH05075.1 LacI family DNA-binding transcriptional regulator [Saccharopolyspora erythraea]
MLRADGRPTLEDVAARAGLSRATVSRVINDSPRVSPEARELVRVAVRELGYVPNRAARTLVTRRTDAVALVLSEPENKFFDDPFFASTVRTVSQHLSAADTQMVLLLVHREDDHVRIARYLSGGHVDGALVLAPHLDDPLPEAVRDLPLPIVFGGRLGIPEAGLHLVDHDNVGGGRLATEHLVGLGRRTVVTVAGPADEYAGIERLDGWRQATGLDERTAAHRSERGDFTEDGGERAMTALLQRVPELDAVFAANDLMAAGALHALRAAGRRVPQDVAVVGFDDQPAVAPRTDPPLTTIRQDPSLRTEHMVDRMARLIAGEPVPTGRTVLPVELVRRESA